MNAIEVFKNIQVGDKYINTSKTGQIKSISRDKIGIKFNDGEYVKTTGINLSDDFIEYGKKSNFEEAFISNKRIRIRHELISERYMNPIHNKCEERFIRECCDRLLNGEFMGISDIMSALGWYYSDKDINEIINNGEWYIEEEE